MLKPRTLKVLVLLLMAYGLLLLLGVVWPSYFDSTAALLVLVPMLSIYLFHKIGIPGLLEHNGLCGWSLCSPTPVGWLFLVVSWLLLAWLLAWGLASLAGRLRGR